MDRTAALPALRPAMEKMIAEATKEAERRIEVRQAQNKLASYASDPEAYARDILKVDWWRKQSIIARSVVENKKTLVVAAFGVGKTHVLGGLANWYFDAHKDGIIITTAPTQDQVRDLLWKEIRTQRKTPPAPMVMRLEDPTNSAHFAVGRAPRDAEAMHGQHAERLFVILDEGAGVPIARWEATDNMVVAETNRVCVIGNPTVSSGPYFEAANSPEWNVIHISVLEHPNILAALNGEPEPYPGAVSMSWLQDKLNDHRWCQHLGKPGSEEERDMWTVQGAFEFPPGQDIWYLPGLEAEIKILGRFPSQAADAVWSMAWFDAACERDSSDADEGRWLHWHGGDPLEVGADIARYGSDWNANHIRRGPCSMLHDTWSQKGKGDTSFGTMETAGRIIANAEKMMDSFHDYDKPPRVEIRVDDAGVGGGVTDRLKERLAQRESWTVVAVNSSESARESDKYPNLRSELWFMAADRAQSGLLNLTRIGEPARSELRRQLTATKWKMDSSSRRVVQTKDEIKKDIGRSPDDADAFNLAYMPSTIGVYRPEDLNDLRKSSRWTGQGNDGEFHSRWDLSDTGHSRWRP